MKGEDSLTVRGHNDTRISLADTYRTMHPDEALVGTFHAFKGSRDGEKIDFVFVQPETKVIHAAIIHDSVDGHYPSDHFPVMARILLPPGM